MEAIAKIKCEYCNRRVNWNVICPVGNQIKIQCPYCGNIVYINKCEVSAIYQNLIFGGNNDNN